MANIKYAIEDIVRKPFIFFIVLLQIIIATMVLNSTLNITLNLLNQKKNLEDIFKCGDICKLKQDEDIFNKEVTNTDNAKQLYDFLKNNKNFYSYFSDNPEILIKDFVNDDKFYTNPKWKIKDVNGVSYNSVRGVSVDENYVKKFPLRISKGRSFAKEDFDSSGYIPIILGSDFKQYYDVGHEFEFYDFFDKKSAKLKVIGILDENSTIIEDYGSVEKMNKLVIQPLQNLNVKTSTEFDFSNMLSICHVVTNNRESSLSSIRKKSKELNLYNYKLISSKEIIREEVDRLSDSLKSSLTISIILLLFVCIGIITVQINTIRDRISEYGVHLLSGARKQDISKRLLYSISIYIILGVSIAEYYFYSINKQKSIIYINVSDNTIAVLFSGIPIAIFLIVLASVIPLLTINKMNITTLMRRKE